MMIQRSNRNRKQRCGRSGVLAAMILFVFLCGCSSSFMTVHAFTSLSSPTTITSPMTIVTNRIIRHWAKLENKNDDLDDDDDDELWDEEVSYDKEGNPRTSLSSSSSSSKNDASLSGIKDVLTSSSLLGGAGNDSTGTTPKLGINIGAQLDPFTEEEAAALKAEATDVINNAVADGIQDIETLRQTMNRDIQKAKKTIEFASELRFQDESSKLQSKIDSLTNNFLEQTSSSRQSTKRAAAASRAMEETSNRQSKSRGIELGTWGIINGRDVIGDPSFQSSTTSSSSNSLLGGVSATLLQQQLQNAQDTNEDTIDEATTPVVENRILIIADVKKDPLAKELVPQLIEKLTNEKNDDASSMMMMIPHLQIDIVSPTSTIPLGGNNAACVITFLSSISQSSSYKSMLERLLRRTYQTSGTGDIGTPPTQLIGISTVGTERTNQFPYSIQNVLGGKLDQRRQMEEVLMNTVQQRVIDPPLDYTILKFGEINTKGSSSPFQLVPGDVLDDPITIDAATNVLVQAIAFQPFARNSTFCVSGDLSTTAAITESTTTSSAVSSISFWREAFLCLDGPELYRIENKKGNDDDGFILGPVEKYDELVEYIQGWAEILADSGKGLTTPIRTVPGLINTQSSSYVQEQDGVSLLFLPTATGSNYMSKSEERERESMNNSGGGGYTSPSSSSSTTARRGGRRDGGIDIVIEITNENQLRIRVRRCNYAEDAIIKELSEKTILKRFQEAIDSWTKKIQRN